MFDYKILDVIIHQSTNCMPHLQLPLLVALVSKCTSQVTRLMLALKQ